MLLKRPVLALSLLISANAFAQSSPVQVVDIHSTSPSGATNHSVPATTLSPQANQNAELIMLIEQLQEEVRFLRGQVEQQNHQMKKMQTNQRDRYRDLDRRIMGITQKMSSQPAPATVTATDVPPPTVTEPEAAVTKAPAVAPPSTTAQQPAGESDKDAYRKAFKMVRSKDYAGSIKAFDEFIRFYPSSNLVANAIFWSGEVYRAMTPPDFKAASDSYSKLIELYPQHSKSADAYYKLGLTLNDLGKKAEAKKVMQKTIDLYPDQSVAGLARDFLAK